MLILLPASAFILTFLALRLRRTDRSWREAFLAAAVIFGTLGVLATEGLSLFHLINFPAIAIFWTIVCGLAAGFLRFTFTRAPLPMSVGAEKPALVVRLFISCIALYVAFIAMIALVAPPNTWDSMEYHLPKVMHWIQNGSVSFYPTGIPRQNHLAPGTEFAILHLQLLSGSDRFANLVEWFGMVGSLVVVSLIARQLGANAIGQCVAAVFAVTLPMGIMQASSTMTDYVTAFWFVSFLYFLLRLLREDAFRWPILLGLSASLGLAVFTKATTYLFAPAFLLWLALGLLKTRGVRAIKAFAAITAIFLLINLGPFTRNWSVYGHPLGPREEPMQNTKYSLESHAPNALLSNLAKNIGTHLNTPWPQFNAAVQRRYVAFHKAIGWELNDPRTSWGPARVRFSIRATRFQEESDGNPVHFLLAVLCGSLVLLLPALRRDWVLLKYTIAVAAGFLLFAFYLKWHPWMSRLHHGLFVAEAALVGTVLVRFGREKIAGAVAGLLLLLGLPWLLFCQQRPVLARENIFNTSREHLYFKTPYQTYKTAFLRGSEFLRAQKPSQVGLLVDNSSWEYMWWVLLRQDNPAIRLQHVNVSDPSRRTLTELPLSDFQPEAVVALDQRSNPAKIVVGSTSYTRRWAEGKVGIYLRD